jgi:hypothetical protein
MPKETKDNRERELDSFLRDAQESHRKPKYPEWEAEAPHRNRRRSTIGIVLIVCLVVLVLILFFAVKELKGIKGGEGKGSVGSGGGLFGQTADNLKIDQGKYQAVFLTNGQVYFGKIATHEGNYVELDDIYYLQVKPVLQQGDNSSNANDNKNPQQQKTELSLVKLGNELHGPLDRMMLNRDQIVFIEDLKDDSKVTEAIHRYQQGQK